jgi:hypothetical protein
MLRGQLFCFRHPSKGIYIHRGKKVALWLSSHNRFIIFLLMWKCMPKCLEHGEKLFLEQSCTFASEKKENRWGTCKSVWM